MTDTIGNLAEALQEELDLGGDAHTLAVTVQHWLTECRDLAPANTGDWYALGDLCDALYDQLTTAKES